MKVRQFRRLPVVIEAQQVQDDNVEEIAQWSGLPIEAISSLAIGDWLTKVGEHYTPCSDRLFTNTYEEIEYSEQ